MVYLVPTLLAPSAVETIPLYVIDAVKACSVIFAENERTARRFLKEMDRSIRIEDFEWFTIHKLEMAQIDAFREKLQQGKNIAIISEAGCPGVADPGQILVSEAQKLEVAVKPLVGPSSILLALMGSGLNGQHFSFHGYLPIENNERTKKIKGLEEESARKQCTQIFIETPYRNNKMMEAILHDCKPGTRLCIAAELTSADQLIKTKSISEWRKQPPELNKKAAIFLLLA